MAEVPFAAPLQAPEERSSIKRLMAFFALVYLVEGIGQTDSLISQPLNYYLKQVFQWTPVEIAAFLAVLNLPWIIKPVYGIVSDFVPLFGYRRKTYLIAANAAAAVAYFAAVIADAPSQLVFLLLLTAYGMAIASTLAGAILVESGQRFGLSAIFVNQEWLWFNLAQLVASILGGYLIEWLSPASAVHAAAAIAGLPPILVALSTWMIIKEEKSAISWKGVRESFAALGNSLGSRQIWVIALFLAFYYFSPGIDTPLYFYMTDNLKFSQAFIGILNSLENVGWILAALLYAAHFRHASIKTLLNWSIFTGVLAMFLFLFVSGPLTAGMAKLAYGGSQMLATVATLGLAADYCPKGSEGFTFAAMMSITNAAGTLADNVGAFLYEHAFRNELYPLLLVAAGFTAVNFVLVPLLGLRESDQTQPVLLAR
ncbi:MAG TPA: MFS transporter [Micropepsaceae bacterium]|nr:MFS transporter [Micropepsaceae bacterium]